MVKSQLIKINSVDVTSYRVTTEIEDTMEDQTDKVIINFSKTILNELELQTFQEVLIYEAYSGTLEQDSNRVFKGVISKIEKEPTKIKVTAYCDLWKAIQTEVNKTYDKNIDDSAGKGSEIFKDLCDLAGLDYDNSTIVDTGTTILLDKFVCNKAEVFERMKTLAEIYGYQIYFRADTGKVYFEPLGYSTNSNTIYIGGANNNVQNLVKWKEDGTKLFNKIEVIGAYQEVQKTETFNGDGSTTEFSLIWQPEIVRVEVDGVEKTGGTEGATSSYDYIVDKDQQKIIFNSAPANSANIVIRYSYRAPRPVILTNPTSISQIGRTIKQRFTFNDIQKVDDAEKRARELLNVYSSPFLSTRVKIKPNVVSDLNLKVGQIIRVVDNRYSYDENMLIRKMKITYPASDIELTLGNKEVKIGDLERDTTIRLKRLEEEMSKSGDFIVEVIDISNDINVKNTYLKIENRTIESGILYWDSDVQGEWDNFNWGDDTEQDWSVNYIKQANNIYIEDFRNDDFKDDATTANWDTSNKELNFNANQIAISKSIDYNNGTINSAKIEVTIDSGNFDIYLSADGTNWESVTNNSTHYFTNTGTNLKWKIEEKDGSTGKITQIKIYNYH